MLCIHYNKQMFDYQLFIEGMEVFMEKKQNGKLYIRAELMVWYKLMIVSLPKEYQDLLNEILK